jgi:hypothetical protein
MNKRKREMTDKQKKGMNGALVAVIFTLLGIMAVLAVIDRSC